MGSVNRAKGDLEKSVELMKKALELNPRSTILPWDIGQTLVLLGRYEEADQNFKLTHAIAPDLNIAYQHAAWNELLWKGDLASARAALESMPDQEGPESTAYWARLLVLEQSYGEAMDKLDSLPWNYVKEPTLTLTLLQKAGLYDLLGRREKVREVCEDARSRLEAHSEGRGDDGFMVGALAIAYAYLGHDQEAISFAKNSVPV